MGSNLSQNRHKLHPRAPRPRMVRPQLKIHRAQAALQSTLFLLPLAHHGRRAQHDPALPVLGALENG